MLGSFPPLRGVSSYCLELATALAARLGVEFLSFKHMYPGFLYPGGRLSLDQSFPGGDHPSLTVHRRMTWYNPFSWVRAGFRTQADLLHAQWWSIPLAPIYVTVCAAFKMRRKPVIFTVHNVMGHERSGFFGAISRVLFALGDHFIVHTEANRRQLVARYQLPPRQVSVIPHGTLDFQVHASADRDRIRSQFGISPSDKVILMFGAIRPYKGIDVGIRAFSMIRRDIPEAKMLIAGKAWEAWDGYRNLIDALGIQDSVIPCLEYVPAGEVHRFFGAADLVLLPYRRFDSQSGVGATAVAFRTPMIVTAVGGLPELVGHAAAVVPPDNPQALARAVKKALQDDALMDELKTSLDAVADGLNWKHIARSTCAVYASTLRRSVPVSRGIGTS